MKQVVVKRVLDQRSFLKWTEKKSTTLQNEEVWKHIFWLCHESYVWLCVVFFCRTLCLRWRTVWGRWSKPSSPSWWMFSTGQSCSSLRTLTLAGSVKAEGSFQSRFKSATCQHATIRILRSYCLHVLCRPTLMFTMTYHKCIRYTMDFMWWFMMTVIYLYMKDRKKSL